MPHWAEMSSGGFEEAVRASGGRPVHARTLLRALYRGAPGTPKPAMSLPRGVLNSLEGWLHPAPAQEVDRRTSADGTIKLLLRCTDGALVECVLMPGERPDRASACLSSQVGCAMGCTFCASTVGGLVRNLTEGEIVWQYVLLRQLAADTGRRLATVVFMGMGEPFHNPDAVLTAAERIAHPEIGGLGWRQITISTVGVVPGIDRLTRENRGFNLALSLHAPDDATRSRIVPMNRRYPVRDVLEAARRFQDVHGRPVNVEYCLLEGVNDSEEHARDLGRLLAGLKMHVNVIPYNPIGVGSGGMSFDKPEGPVIRRFLEELGCNGIVAHLRRTRGDDVSAACGQLRASHQAACADRSKGVLPAAFAAPGAGLSRLGEGTI